MSHKRKFGLEVDIVLAGLHRRLPGRSWNYLDPRFPERVVQVEQYPQIGSATSWQFYLMANHLKGRNMWVDGDMLDMLAACATIIEREP